MKRSRTIDMTKGPIFGPLVRFMLPLIGGSIFQQLYNTVDFIFVGNCLDQTAAAAEVRGFRLRTRECAWKRYPFHGIDLAAALFCAVLLAAAIIL